MKKTLISLTAAALAVSNAMALTVLTDGSSNATVDAAISRDGTGNLILSSDLNLQGIDTEFVLEEILFIGDGDTATVGNVTLTVPSGTIIRGEANGIDNARVGAGARDETPGTIVVTRGSKLYMNGSKFAPVIFTTAALDDNADLGADAGIAWNLGSGGAGAPNWLDDTPRTAPLPLKGDGNDDNRELCGGIVILGFAPTNNGKATVTAGPAGNIAYSGIADEPGGSTFEYGEGWIEGIDSVLVGDIELSTYGGHNPNDNSGSLTYVSIRHGGSRLSTANEINGLTCGGVGRGTRLAYIEVYCGKDDGFEFFGGTVDASYLLSIHNDDDSFDLDEGYTGTIQFGVVLDYPDSNTGDHGVEADGSGNKVGSSDRDALNILGVTSGGGDNFGGLPQASALISHLTIIGQGTDATDTDDSEADSAFRFRDSWGGKIANTIAYGCGGFAFRTDGDSNFSRVEIKNLILDDFGLNTNVSTVNSTGGAIVDTVANIVASDDAGVEAIVEAKLNDAANNVIVNQYPFKSFFGSPTNDRDRTGLGGGAFTSLVDVDGGTVGFDAVPDSASPAAAGAIDASTLEANLAPASWIGAFENGKPSWSQDWSAAGTLVGGNRILE